jgi:hypothetical protein
VRRWVFGADEHETETIPRSMLTVESQTILSVLVFDFVLSLLHRSFIAISEPIEGNTEID